MNKREAREYLYWYKSELDTDHYLARFKSHKPLCITNSEYAEKAVQAKIVLGVFQWQKPFELLVERYPNLTKEKYEQYRKKYGLTKS